jgi:hypothetical protein
MKQSRHLNVDPEARVQTSPEIQREQFVAITGYFCCAEDSAKDVAKPFFEKEL